MKHLLTICIFLILSLSSLAQDKWIEYSTTTTGSNDLLDKYISDIVIDKNENIWFATGDGLSVYDGKNWTNYTFKDGLANTAALGIFQDSKGNMWFCYCRLGSGYWSGVTKFDGEKWITYKTTDGLINDDIRCIAEDNKGNMWFGSSKGASKFDGKTFENFTTDNGLSDNVVNTIISDKNGNVYFGTNNGISIFDGSNFTCLNSDNGLWENRVLSLFIDNKNKLWIGCWNALSNYDGQQIINYISNKCGLTANYIETITQDLIGNILVGTDKGLYSFDGSNWKNFNAECDFMDGQIPTIAIDKNGRYWMSIFNSEGGIYIYDGSSWEKILKDGLCDNNVTAIFEDYEKNIWFGTSLGLSKYNGQTWENYSEVEGDKIYGILNIKEDSKKDIWIASRRGIFIYSKGTWTVFDIKSTIPNSDITACYITDNNEIWLTTLVQTYHIVNNVWSKVSELDNVYVQSIFQDKDRNLWFGASKNFYKFNGANWEQYEYSLSSSSTSRTIAQDNTGTLWFGTSVGLFTLVNDELVSYKSNSTSTSSIFPEENRLIVSTPLPNTSTGPRLKIIENGNWYDYPVLEGLNTNVWCFMKTSKGDYWAGTQKGAYQLKSLTSSEITTQNNYEPLIYPTIVKDYLHINWKSNDRLLKKLAIYNISGTLCFKKNFDNKTSETTILLTNYKKGIYIAKMETPGKVFYQKIFIEE